MGVCTTSVEVAVGIAGVVVEEICVAVGEGVETGVLGRQADKTSPPVPSITQRKKPRRVNAV